MRVTLLGLAATMALSACIPAPTTSPASQPAPGKPPVMTDGPDECGMVSVQNYVGQPVAKFDAIQWTAHPYRVIRPGEGVTMDFNPARLNVWADDGDNITRMSCG